MSPVMLISSGIGTSAPAPLLRLAIPFLACGANLQVTLSDIVDESIEVTTAGAVGKDDTLGATLSA